MPAYRSQLRTLCGTQVIGRNILVQFAPGRVHYSGEPDGGVYQNCMFWDYSYTATSNAARDFSCTNAFYYPLCQTEYDGGGYDGLCLESG